MIIHTAAVYVLWAREMKRFVRAKSRMVGALATPLFFLAFLGLGFNRMAVPGMRTGVDYIHFLVPVILGMSLLFSSTFAGMSVLWDREFGFLKEIMVTPVNRFSIVIGRIAGGATTAIIQGLMLILITVAIGFRIPSAPAFFLALLFMLLITTTFIGLGLIFASIMRDMQGFGLVMNFVMFPMFFLSGAMYPLKNLPLGIRVLAYLDPLSYGVDGLRGALVGVSAFPILADLAAMTGWSVIMVFLGAWLFEKSESV
jgi:ABC-2 type transport system permease protein